MEIAAPGVRVQFVHLQAGGLGWSGMVLFASERCAEAVDAPMSGRDFPSQGSVGTKLLGQIHRLRNRGPGLRRGVIGQIYRRGKTGFLLRVVHFRYRVQLEFVDAGAGGFNHGNTIVQERIVRLGIDHHQAEIPGRGFRDVGRKLRNRAGGNA